MSDPNMHRPAYHFMPPSRWMNDPNGPIWYKGYYHMFYQYNPFADIWGSIHWGHARSIDLVNWEHLPIALAPDDSANELHCFSGCLVLHEGVPTILYTSVEKDRNQRHWATIRLARSYNDMLTWQREAAPILTQDIHEERVGEWRDPFVWYENNEWNMLVGGEQNGYGCIFLYRSKNLTSWQYIAPFVRDKSAPFLECPNLLRFGEKSVLIYSPHGEVVYHIGQIMPDGRFESESSGVLDHSGRIGFYAPNTLLNDPKGRYLTWGWLTEEARCGFNIDGYSGALSLPREISLSKDNKLVIKPAKEYESLRTESEIIEQTSICDGMLELKTFGRKLEIQISAEYDSEDDFSLLLLKTPSGNEQTSIRFSAKDHTVLLERSLTSLHNEPSKTFQQAVVRSDNNRLSMQIFLDHSIIEIYINDREVVSGRLYPTMEGAENICVIGTIKSISAKIWKLDAAQFTLAEE